MSVHFVIDSASDVLPKEAAALGVAHLPLKVIFGETEYADSVTLSHREFYEKLTASKAFPSTSQLTPGEFAACCEPLVAAGHSVVVITVSSKLSGTYQSAMIAAAEFPGKVFVVDSLSAAIGERILLERGLQLAEQGLSACEIAQTLDKEKRRIRVLAMIDTLEYLKKGGRISAATALAGGLLSIKPAIEIRDGEVAIAGKARGAQQSYTLMKSAVESYGGVNFDRPVALVYANSDEQLRAFIANTPELWGGRRSLPCYSLGCVIGAHIGPGAYGIAFFETE